MSTHTRLLLSLFVTGLFISLSTPALAARSYLIELVVFSMQDRGDDEKWITPNPPLNEKKMSRAKLPAQIMDEYKEVPIEIKESNFSSYVDRIRENPERNIILATHWVQAVLDPASTIIARITNREILTDDLKTDNIDLMPDVSGDQLPTSQPVLDGFINFYLTGQYTLEADIRYTPVYRPSILDEEPATGPVSYRIYEKRRIKSGELNYYDHPKIGMVLRVTPVEMPTEEESKD
ncbi:MAG: hypothetical protein GXP23_08300 [Gammaproteobacteria bacterium]|nr:hypothetical protein [Gammaproteobacteria bacterium]